MGKHTFKISDESLNSYGFWVKSDGIDTVNFSRNPVMLFNHNKEAMPIGTWENLRVENGELLADAVFDMDDTLGKEVARKVEKGFIRGASMGLRIRRFSDDRSLIKEGQQRATLVESELTEVSVTAFPSNRNALKLYDTSGEVQLNEMDEITIPKMNINPKQSTMKEVMKKLGLSEDASQEAAMAAVEKLQGDVTQLRQHLNTAFVKLGEATGAITDENRERMIRLAEKDYDLALSFLTPPNASDDKADKATPPESTLRLSDLIKELRGTAKADTEKDYDWYQKNDPAGLELMMTNEPEKFQKLFDAHFKTA
jgi:HK97 family phage prohead protease